MSPWNNPPEVVAAVAAPEPEPLDYVAYHPLDIDRVRAYIDRLTGMLRDTALARPELKVLVDLIGEPAITKGFAETADSFKRAFRVETDVPLGYMRMKKEGSLQFTEVALTTAYMGLENKKYVEQDLANFRKRILTDFMKKEKVDG